MPTPSRVSLLARFRSKWMPGVHLSGFPLRSHLRDYPRGAWRADALAALNVTLLSVPQALAFATIVGLPLEAAAIVCGGVAAILGGLLSGSRYTIIGPTNATALMAFSALTGMGVGLEYLPALVGLTGVILIASAGLRMADLIQYISRSVTVGYLTGAAILIAAGQLREAAGIPAQGPRSATFFGMLDSVVSRWPEKQWAAIFTGLSAAITYGILRRWAPRWPAFALALAVSAGFAALSAHWGHPVATFAAFNPGSLWPDLPHLFPLEAWQNLGQLMGPAMALAFLAALENTIMSKGLSGRSGSQPDLNQDLFACGVANLGSALAGGMPASGSLTRSALNYSSGARTPLSAVWAGVLSLIIVILLGRVVVWIPRAGLAALFICVAVALVKPRQLRICWKATRSDAVTLALTILASLSVPLHAAIFMGVAVSMILYLRKAARPVLVEYEFGQGGELQAKSDGSTSQNPGISIVHVEGELFFGAAELFRTQILRTARDPQLRILILRMKNARHLDATSVMALEDLTHWLHSHQRHLIISGLSKEVYRVLLRSGMIEIIGRENIFMGSAQNPNLSTRKALKRAQALIGTATADIRIFYDPTKPR